MAIFDFTIQIAVLVFSIVLHEVAHGAMAERLGDQTAKMAGRLSLNPIKHIDPIGSVLVPLMLIFSGLQPFGWAKPVPINPYNFRDRKYGEAKSAIAGPLANIGLAIFFGLLIRFLPHSAGLFWQNLFSTFSYIVILNLILAVFNLVPIPPLDGSHILFALFPRKWEKARIFLSVYGFLFLIIFIFFLSPIIFPVVSLLFGLITGIPFN